MSIGLKGKRYINLLRCSTLLNDTSTTDQKSANDKFAAQHEMIYVRDEELQGVSASKTFNRTDLKRLLAERKAYQSFDVLLVYDSSRLTRGGASHGNTVRSEFARAGVLVQSVVDPVPEGDFKDVMQSVIDTQNNLYSKKLSGFVTRGIVQNLLRNDCEHHGGLSLGIDRLYVRPTTAGPETPFLRLRYLPGRVRRLIEEPSGNVLRDFHPKVDTGTAYRKQASDKVRLSPGDPIVVAAIREVFELRYKHHWGYCRLSRHLVAKGIKPLESNIWRGCTVRQMLLNPMYLGWSYLLKASCGLFHVGHPDRPQPRHIDQMKLEGERETVPHERRNLREMILREHPLLADVITDPVVRKKAEQAIEKMFAEYDLPRKRNLPNNDKRNPTSAYFLRQIMKDARYGKGFVGQSLGRKQRYYVLSGRFDFSETGDIARRVIPARPVEKAVLDVLKHVLANSERVAELVHGHVKKVLGERPELENREALTDELEEIKDRLSYIFEEADRHERQRLKVSISQMQRRREEIEHELEMVPLNDLSREAAKISASARRVRRGCGSGCPTSASCPLVRRGT